MTQGNCILSAPIRQLLGRVALAAAACCTVFPARAGIVTADLGAGLEYIHISDASIIAKHEGSQVVDLRFTDALEESAEGLAGRLRAAAGSGAMLLVLVNSATDPLLRNELALVQGKVRSILFIGPATPELAPEILTETDVEQDRRACDALASGVPADKLINEVVEKPRYDEAHLVRSRTSGNPDGRTDGDEPSATLPTPDETPKDPSLQRAVFLHRALIALGRRPSVG